jgi:hypothetical protein
MARWGMPGPPQFGGQPVTNIRNLNSPHWRGWLGKNRRCVVPATSFCEYADTKPRKTPTWFAPITAAITPVFSNGTGARPFPPAAPAFAEAKPISRLPARSAQIDRGRCRGTRADCRWGRASRGTSRGWPPGLWSRSRDCTCWREYGAAEPEGKGGRNLAPDAASNEDPLHLVERHFLCPAIIKLRRARAGMVLHLRRSRQTTATGSRSLRMASVCCTRASQSRIFSRTCA